MTNCIFNGVAERDMDLMFLHLFSMDEDFAKTFLKLTGLEYQSCEVISVELSKVDAKLGESDITVVLDVDSAKVALLIEDKIDAIDMPEQPERYIMRGELGITNGEYDRFYSFIVCPQKYYDSNDAAKKYPYHITYEQVLDYLTKKESHCYSSFCQQIEQALDKVKKPSNVIINESANVFFNKYKDYQETHYPNLDLRTNRSSNGYWAWYGTRLGDVYLNHKIKEGSVDLTFNNASTRMNDLESLMPLFNSSIIGTVRAREAGKAGVIRADVPKLDMSIPFEDNDQADVGRCFEVISEMIRIANMIAVAGDMAREVL